jgi:RNA polymerase sigma-70 factor (ECF subfamily)
LAAKLRPEPPEQPEDVEDTICKCVHDLLPGLEPGYAELVRRIDLNGEPRGRVAESLHMSPQTLTVRLLRARRALRRALLRTCSSCPIDGFRDCGCHHSNASANGAGAKC